MEKEYVGLYSIDQLTPEQLEELDKAVAEALKTRDYLGLLENKLYEIEEQESEKKWKDGEKRSSVVKKAAIITSLAGFGTALATVIYSAATGSYNAVEAIYKTGLAVGGTTAVLGAGKLVYDLVTDAIDDVKEKIETRKLRKQVKELSEDEKVMIQNPVYLARRKAAIEFWGEKLAKKMGFKEIPEDFLDLSEKSPLDFNTMIWDIGVKGKNLSYDEEARLRKDYDEKLEAAAEVASKTPEFEEWKKKVIPILLNVSAVKEDFEMELERQRRFISSPSGRKFINSPEGKFWLNALNPRLKVALEKGDLSAFLEDYFDRFPTEGTIVNENMYLHEFDLTRGLRLGSIPRFNVFADMEGIQDEKVHAAYEEAWKGFNLIKRHEQTKQEIAEYEAKLAQAEAQQGK